MHNGPDLTFVQSLSRGEASDADHRVGRPVAFGLDVHFSAAKSVSISRKQTF